MTEVRITLPIRVMSEANLRCHWAPRAKRMAAHRAVVRMALASKRAWPLMLPVVVELTRIAPRELDGDNLQGGLKGARDGVADALGVDDRDKGITWVYSQKKGAPKTYAVEIHVSEAPF